LRWVAASKVFTCSGYGHATYLPFLAARPYSSSFAIARSTSARMISDLDTLMPYHSAISGRGFQAARGATHSG
jgi:hypothetical protein